MLCHSGKNSEKTKAISISVVHISRGRFRTGLQHCSAGTGVTRGINHAAIGGHHE